MPLNIRIPNPQDYSGAVLPHIPTIAEIIDSIPNLVGVWHPGSLPLGAVASLPPTFGPTTLSATANVNRGILGGAPAITFDTNNTRLMSSWPLTEQAEATVFLKFFVRDAVGDFQNVYGPSGYRLLYRDEASSFPRGLHWSAPTGWTDITGMVLAAPIQGWHTAELYIGEDVVRVVVDGIEYSGAREAGSNLNSNLFFGNNAGAGNSTSVGMGPMFAANADIYGTDEAAALRSYLLG